MNYDCLGSTVLICLFPEFCFPCAAVAVFEVYTVRSGKPFMIISFSSIRAVPLRLQ